MPNTQKKWLAGSGNKVEGIQFFFKYGNGSTAEMP